MRALSGFAAFWFLCSITADAQVVAAAPTPISTNSAQATLLIAQAVGAITGNLPISDATVAGTAELASTNERGNATFKMLGTQYGRVDLALPSGTQSVVRNDSDSNCGVSLDSVGHRSTPPRHQCWLAPAWFSPLAWLNSATTMDSIILYVGAETHNGILTERIHVYRDFANRPTAARTLLQDLTRFDLYLDSVSHLPIAIGFADHPDNNAGGDLPAEIQFSDYRKTGTATLPFHIRRLSQHALLLDITVSTVALNSGLSQSEFSVQ